MHYQVKDLFQLQSELIEAKVNIAVNDKIDRVVDQIHLLKDEMRNDMQELRSEVHDFRVEINSRLIAVETKLGMTNEFRRDIRTRLLDYLFKAGWVVLGLIGTYHLYLGLHHFS